MWACPSSAVNWLPAPRLNPCRQAFLDTTQGKPPTSTRSRPSRPSAGLSGGHGVLLDCDGKNVIDAKTGDNTWKVGTSQSYLVLERWPRAPLDELLYQPPARPPSPTPTPPTPAPPPMRSGVNIHIAKHRTSALNSQPGGRRVRRDGRCVVDCTDNTSSAGRQLWDLEPVTDSQQQWRCAPAARAQRASGSGGGSAGRYCLTVDSRHGDIPSGAPAVLTPCDAARDDQLWSFTGSGDTSCVSNVATGNYLSVSGLVDPYLWQFIEVWSPKEMKMSLSSDPDCGPAESVSASQ